MDFTTIFPFFFFFFCLLSFVFFRSPPTALGSSQARGPSELQLPAYTTATATLDLSSVCDLHHSLQQHWILNPQSEARDLTHILIEAS